MTQIMMARYALALQEPRLIFKQGGTKIAAPSRKTHQRPSYGLVSSREVQIRCKPTASRSLATALWRARSLAACYPRRSLLDADMGLPFRGRLTAGAVKPRASACGI